MAEYQPLLMRATSNVRSDPGARIAIYKRAKDALTEQLRRLDPPIPEWPIEREISALEDSIKDVEGEISDSLKSSDDPTISPEDAISQIEEAASPLPRLSESIKLDAGSNPIFDQPIFDNQITTYPIRQRYLIKNILGDLPGNAPRILKSALQDYSDELLARGAQPIVGLLKDMATIVEACAGESNADREWMSAGLKIACDRFLENHKALLSFFVGDIVRESIYNRTPISESHL